MDILETIFKNGLFQRIVWCFIIVFLNIFIYHLVSKFLASKENKNSKVFSNKKNKTYIRMLKSIVAYTLGILTILVVLQIFGVNVSSMLAGVGIASIIVGFALQDAMKDIFRGLDIISDGYYDIGDVIKYQDTIGVVQSISIRTTKVQDWNTMNIVSIANRNIVEVEVVSGYIYITVPLPLRIKPDAADKLVSEIAKGIQALPGVTSAENQGVTDITSSSLNYQIQLTCDPTNKLPTRRAALGVVVSTLADHKIMLPYQQLEFHNKKSA